MVLARPQIVDMPRVQRVMRRPQHPFQIRQKPFAITPFFMAPVLPGETLKNLLMQARVVSDPVLHPLIGWWQEFYFFYVKHRDLDARDDLTNMMLSPNWTPAGSTEQETVEARYFHVGTASGNQINWGKLMMKRIVEEYFRNDGEAWDTWLIDGYPAAQINNNSWLDSAITATAMTAQDVDVEGPDANSTIQASEVDSAMRQWELLRMQNLTQQTYEEFLMTYGVKPDPVQENRPELVRYVREWTYPSNTINPSTGTPSSALSWSIAERADKDRYFKEPGFLFGVTVSRPKVYLSRQRGTLQSFMNNVYRWLPATLQKDMQASWASLTPAAGPLNTNQADSYWVDFRDLFIHGEQFVNFALASGASGDGSVPLPTTAMQKRYPTETDMNNLFVDNVTAAKVYVRSDGIVNLTVASPVRDYSPTVNV